MQDRPPSLALAVLLSVASLAGCDKTAEPKECRELRAEITRLEAAQEQRAREAAAAAEPEPEALPNIQVQLPVSPKFAPAEVPVRWEDDADAAYSIYGLRKDIDDRLAEGERGQTVIVKGWVQEVFLPPECPAGQLCRPTKQAHFWITDAEGDQGKKRAMMVVNHEFPIPEWDIDTQEMFADQPRVTVEVGKRYTIEGKFKRISNTGFSHRDGLLEFHAYRAPKPGSPGEQDWIYPPNAAWHPLTVAAVEAQNAELQALMAKQAEARRRKQGG